MLLALLAQQAMGHAIWIETNTEAKIGELAEVRIFFGEPNETNKPTPTAKWYSDLNTLSLSLISPFRGKRLFWKRSRLNGVITPTLR